MRKLICLIITLVAILAANAHGMSGKVLATSLYTNTDENARYKISVKASPEMAGEVYVYNDSCAAGEEVWLQAYNRDNFRFVRWTHADTLVSMNNYFMYKMPAEDVELIAEFVYSPNSPADPETKAKSHHVILNSVPAMAGQFSFSSGSKFDEGTISSVYAWAENNFVFTCWMCGDSVVSRSSEYQFTMGGEDICLTAMYEYKPTSPAEPSLNYWNIETGEAIMDRFDCNNLWNALSNKVGDANAVTMLTVAGNISNSDVCIAQSLQRCSYLDLSRTYGFSEIPSYAYSYNSVLQTLILPECVERIGYSAFINVSRLMSLTCYAVTPPIVETNGLAMNGESSPTVYVPFASVALYEQADGWKDFDIQPIQSEVVDLTLKLPNECSGKYKNMILELLNLSSGMKYQFVITDAVSYTFSNLLKNTSYDLTLKNSQGIVLAMLNDIEVQDADKEVSFESILDVFTPAVAVVAGAEDVTSQCNISWFNAEGAYVGQGNRLTGIVEGTELSYKVVIPQTLAMQYILPESVTCIVEEDCDYIYTLLPIGRLTFTGLVRDITTDDALECVNVTISQKLNGQYSKSINVSTDADGQFATEAWNEKTATIVFSKDGYVSKAIRMENVEGNQNLGNIALRSITGAQITTNLLYRKSTQSGPATYEQLTDHSNITYTIFNNTQQKYINDFSVQYPKIILLEEVAENDEILITAKSVTDEFNDVKTRVVIDDKQTATADIIFVQRGGISASFVITDNAAIVGVLYNSNGDMLSKYSYDKQTLNISNLADGQYTLVSMANSNLFNKFATLTTLEESGLKEYEDYLLGRVTVESGYISVIKNQSIPFLDETKLYYTDNQTSFFANKSSVNAGNYVTLKGMISFKDSYENQVSDVNMIIDLPSDCEFVAGSVMIGHDFAGYMVSDRRITIPLQNLSEQVKFCIVPTSSGDHAPTAYAQFLSAGQTILQPIGSAPFVVKDLSITLPEVVSRTSFKISGTAKAGCDVDIYDGTMLIGQTTSLANGQWMADVVLHTPTDSSYHSIYANVTTDAGLTLRSETKTLQYISQAIEAKEVKFYHHNPEMGRTYELTFDLFNPLQHSQNYVYYIYNRKFTFTVDFTDNTAIKSAVIYVKTGLGNVYCIDAEYIKSKNLWVGEGNFGHYYDGDIPVNVFVDFSMVSDNLVHRTDIAYNYICPDVTYIIDPSGYVYEAVQSNRIKGVKATAFYKELKEDQYGDMHETEVLWDAEKYAQENPLFTDENGMYRWDVPTGTWRVKFEKEGYVTTYSDWLPVPPPQLEVNVAMTNTDAPTVKSVVAFEDGVDVEFSKYMQPSTLTTQNITLIQNGNNIPGTITLLNEESIDETKYASKLRFIKDENTTMTTTSNVILMISRNVNSYTGIKMLSDYTQEFQITKEVKSIEVPANINILYGQEGKNIVVTTVPADAVIGKTLHVTSSSDMIATVTSDAIFDKDGKAIVKVNGELPGVTTLSYKIQGTSVTAQSTVDVTKIIKKVDAPVATKASGTAVYRGSKVVLTCSTDGATIYYTLDGTIPTAESGLIYSEPIIIADDVTIKTFAIADGYDEVSDIKTYAYTIKKSSIGLDLSKGWNWISHNLEGKIKPEELITSGVSRFVGYDKELVNDPIYGLVGNLHQVVPSENYKVLVVSAQKTALSGYEIDAAQSNIIINKGWNWIGYPVNQSTTLDEAFYYAHPSEDDYIVGQDGFAEYTGGSWIGTLDKLDPGKGYMYWAQAPMTFAYNTAVVSNAKSIYGGKKTDSHPWVTNPHAYPNAMCLVSDIFDGESKLDANSYYLGAFSGEECRGIAKVVTDKYMMNIYGNNGEEIIFRIVNRQTGTEYELNERILFSETIYGSVKVPYVFTLSGATGIDTISNVSHDSTPVYNVNGQIVNENYHGIVVKNNNKLFIK